MAFDPIGAYTQGRMAGMRIDEKKAGPRQAEEERARKARMSEVLVNNDPVEIAEFVRANPQLTEQVETTMSFLSDDTKNRAVGAYTTASRMLKADDTEGAIKTLQNHVEYVKRAGGDPASTVSTIRQITESPGQAVSGINLGVAAMIGPEQFLKFQGVSGGQATGVQQAQYVEGLGYVQQLRDRTVKLEQLSPEQQKLVKDALTAKAEREATAAGLKTASVEEEKTLTAKKLEEQKGLGKVESGLMAEDMTGGRNAIKAMPKLVRAMELLNTVATSGWRGSLLGAKQYFGIEAADETELQAKLKEAVLSNLKTTYGGSPSEGEREALQNVAANFGISPEANRRLLQEVYDQSLKDAKRGLKAAVAAKNYRVAADLEENIKDAELQVQLLKKGGKKQTGDKAVDDQGFQKVGKYEMRVIPKRE